MDTSIPAQALQLLFKKIHPHLLDAEHALTQKAKTSELERLHRRLMNAREQAVGALEEMAEKAEGDGLSELSELISESADNLSPMEESFQQSLILTQLCLEQSLEDLASLVSESDLESSWGKRMQAFQEELKDPAKAAEARWKDVDPDIGEAEMD